MAIYHLSMKPISRSSGRSAVAAAAYRSGTRLTNERDGLTHDFTRKSGIADSEIVLPEGIDAEWARDREALWNAAEASENRKDARVAREFELALPHELTGEQRLELTRDFAHGLADKFGTAVDFAIHSLDSDTDIRNHHAHVMMTTRTVGPDGLGDKTNLERENKWLLAHDLPASQVQLKEIRLSWEELANEHLARAGHDVRIDHRSHEDRGLEIEPTEHVGVHATQMQARGKLVERERIDDEAAKRNADLIRQKPDQVLSIITGEKSVFTKADVARTLHRYINDDPTEYQTLLTKVMASDELVKLRDEGPDQRAVYSTREMVDLEAGMARAANALQRAGSHAVRDDQVSGAIATQDRAIQKGVEHSLAHAVASGAMSSAERDRRIRSAGLSDEQRHAVQHITGAEGIAVVVGYAGAGKSTMLAAAREAWEADGHNVYGAALAGKAAEGLEESSGIQSRTLASWDYRLKTGAVRFGRGDVLVIDEAGMVGSKQMAGFVSQIERAGAKLVLVGDHEQLQAIGAGAPFRAMAEQVGFASLQDIRRQREDWQKAASVQMASHRTGEALEAYERHGALHLEETTEQARAALVRDYVADREERPNGSRVAMAHRRADVAVINAEIRSALQARGELAQGEEQGARTFKTINGERSFVAGDRIVFLENDGKLGVKNGMLGTLERIEDGRLVTRIDGKDQRVTVDVEAYKAVDHGYATTIHKTQGATVDRGFVLASGTMDRHLSYVAMTRHRDDVQLYGGQDEFEDLAGLKRMLGRARLKETTLDYADAFAARRGMPELHSNIVYPTEAQARDREPEVKSRSKFTGLKLKKAIERTDPAQQHTDIDAPEVPANTRGRSKFAGLKLRRAPEPAEPAKEQTRDMSQTPRRDKAPAKQIDPAERADRFVNDWNKLKRERAASADRRPFGGRDRFGSSMMTLLQELARDPQMERALRDRRRELGLENLRQGQDLAQELVRKVERDRNRDRDRGMER